MANYWLVKFAPFRTSWADIVWRGTFTMRGVRNRQARNNLAAMRKDESVLYYHSQQELAVVGIMKIVREAYPDPTSSDPQWLTCDFIPDITLPRPVTLAEIKAELAIMNIALIRQPRLAVMKLAKEEFETIVHMASVIN